MMNSIIFKNIVPIMTVHLGFLILWLVTAWFFEDSTIATIFEMIINVFFVPGYLIILNTDYIMESQKKHLNIYLLFIISSIAVFISNFFHYFNWGITSGYLLRPDSETVYIRNLIIKINFITLIVWLVIIQVKLLFSSDNSKKSDNFS